MIDSIYGSFNVPRLNDKYEQLWHKLAPQYTDDKMTQLAKHNNGITQKKNEIIELWQLFYRMQPKIILEIGVSQGGTFAGWCQLAPDDALIIGIDRSVNDCRPHPEVIWLGAPCGPVHPDITCQDELKNTSNGGGMYALKRRGSNQNIVPINGWSYEDSVMKQLLDVLDQRKIDFCFHDASHLYDMTVKDFDIFWPLIAPGGVMAFHDIAYSSSEGSTKWKWWREIQHNGPQFASYTYELNDKWDANMGIGVLFKGSKG